MIGQIDAISIALALYPERRDNPILNTLAHLLSQPGCVDAESIIVSALKTLAAQNTALMAVEMDRAMRSIATRPLPTPPKTEDKEGK